MRVCISLILRIAVAGVLDSLVLTSAQAQDSLNYQLTPAHTGVFDFHDGFQLPFRKIWARNLGQLVSQPTVAEGKVFVTVAKDQSGDYGTILVALDAATGQPLWRKRIAGSYWWSSVTYSSGKLFVLNVGGLIRAFDPANGAELWEKQLPQQYDFPEPPTVSGGLLYITGLGIGETLYAVDGASGEIVWSQDKLDNDSGAPTVSGDGVFVASSCHIYQFDALTGAPRWNFEEQCAGGNEFTSVYYADRLYVLGFAGVVGGVYSYDASIYSALDGSLIGKVKDVQTLPAFRGGVGYFPSLEGIIARSVATNQVLWRWRLGSRVALPPVVINGNVVVISQEGAAFVLDGASGNKLQRIELGTTVPASFEGSQRQPLAGVGIGESMVVIPAGSHLIALKDAAH